jgi:hypothetical protein
MAGVSLSGHQFRSQIDSRLRCSSVSLKVLTANASVAFSFDASTVPRWWARWRRIETRQDRGLASVGFCFERLMPPDT